VSSLTIAKINFVPSSIAGIKAQLQEYIIPIQPSAIAIKIKKQEIKNLYPLLAEPFNYWQGCQRN